MIQIGDKVRFRPSANTDHSAGFPDVLAVEVEGTVVYINEAHHWYRVRCDLPGCSVFHECFPFPIEETEPRPSYARHVLSAQAYRGRTNDESLKKK